MSNPLGIIQQNLGRMHRLGQTPKVTTVTVKPRSTLFAEHIALCKMNAAYHMDEVRFWSHVARNEMQYLNGWYGDSQTKATAVRAQHNAAEHHQKMVEEVALLLHYYKIRENY